MRVILYPISIGTFMTIHLLISIGYGLSPTSDPDDKSLEQMFSQL